MAKSIYNRFLTVDDEGDDVWVMRKFDLDLNAQGEYEIRESHTGELICNCPARAQECRHIRMFEMFTNAEAGEDPIYDLMQTENPDNHIWLQTDAKSFKWVLGLVKEATDDVSF